MLEVVLASSNPSKANEIRKIFNGFPIRLIAQSDFAVPDVEETGSTFMENAIIKARHATCYSGLPALGDDSGLVVPALNGEPGIFSSRYAGKNADDADRIKKLVTELKKIKSADRTAFFYCAVALMRNERDPAPIIGYGMWEGEILSEPRGNKGFGYDPIFYVPTHECSAGELEEPVKNAISHRGQALAALKVALKSL